MPGLLILNTTLHWLMILSHQEKDDFIGLEVDSFLLADTFPRAI